MIRFRFDHPCYYEPGQILTIDGSIVEVNQASQWVANERLYEVWGDIRQDAEWFRQNFAHGTPPEPGPRWKQVGQFVARHNDTPDGVVDTVHTSISLSEIVTFLITPPWERQP